LYANLGNLQSKTSILEFTSHLRPADIVEKLLSKKPKIIGFGIYIWNTEHTTKVIGLLRVIAPEITIIIGGPEVSYEYEEQAVFNLSHYLIRGAADTAFSKLCHQLLHEVALYLLY